MSIEEIKNQLKQAQKQFEKFEFNLTELTIIIRSDFAGVHLALNKITKIDITSEVIRIWNGYDLISVFNDGKILTDLV